MLPYISLYSIPVDQVFSVSFSAQLMSVLEQIKSDLVDRVLLRAYTNENMTERLDKLMQTHLSKYCLRVSDKILRMKQLIVLTDFISLP